MAAIVYAASAAPGWKKKVNFNFNEYNFVTYSW